jgi:Uncharacterized conserved protein
MYDLQIKRVYDDLSMIHGKRVLVDRIWPRGVSKAKLALDSWEKAITPTTELRKAFNHQPEKFAWFKQEYLNELATNPSVPIFVAQLQQWLQTEEVVLLYAAKDPIYNHVVILRDYLCIQLAKKEAL